MYIEDVHWTSKWRYQVGSWTHGSRPVGLVGPTGSRSERASLVAQLVKSPPALRETWVQSLGWEDPLEKGKATHSSILA